MKEATYGVEKSVINSEDQAFKKAEYYLETDEFTKEETAYWVTQTEKIGKTKQ